MIWWSTRTAPSCFDNFLNQNEEGVDCGGVCEKICENKYQIPPKIIKSGFLQSGFDQYVFWAKIENTNPKLGISNLSYQFKAIGRNGENLGNFEGMIYILPNETKYILYENAKISVQISRLDLLLRDPVFVDFADYRDPRLTVKEKNISFLADQVNIKGYLTNQSNFDFNAVKAIGIILDKSSGDILAAGSTYFYTLLSNETRMVEITWPKTINANSENLELDIIGETNVFDQNNYYQNNKVIIPIR